MALTAANQTLVSAFATALARQAKAPGTVVAYATRVQALLTVHEQTGESLDVIAERLPLNATKVQTLSALRAWYRFLGTEVPVEPRSGWNAPSAAMVRIALPRRVQWAAVHLHDWVRGALLAPNRPGKQAPKRLLREIGVDPSPWSVLAWLSWEYVAFHEDTFDIVPLWRPTKLDDLWKPVMQAVWEYAGRPNPNNPQSVRQWAPMSAERRPDDALPLIGRRAGNNRGRYAFHTPQELRGVVEMGGFRTIDPPPPDDEMQTP